MTYHLFHRGGYEPRTIVVEADSETEARGKMQKETTTGVSPKYRGTLSDVMEGVGSDVLDLNRI